MTHQQRESCLYAIHNGLANTALEHAMCPSESLCRSLDQTTTNEEESHEMPNPNCN
jgi:hypothetical protein